VTIEGPTVDITIEDKGIGIADIEEARQPLYTSKPELERSGMGFTIMENFMDTVEVTSGAGLGTRIRLVKRLETKNAIFN
jgi:stage II sporulation protein AB (anti-sigma F factor)